MKNKICGGLYETVFIGHLHETEKILFYGVQCGGLYETVFIGHLHETEKILGSFYWTFT